MKTNTHKTTVSAMLIAIAAVLSMFKIYELPFGGTVTFASMVPIILIAYIYGTKWGLFSSLVYSFIQLILGVVTGIVSKMFLPGDEQMVLWQAISICFIDYILAYFMLGLGGIFKGRMKDVPAIVCGAILATFLCWLMHVISGYIFYGAWAQWFFGEADGLSQIGIFQSFCNWVIKNMHGNILALFYSAVYNACYMIPESIITVIVTPIIYMALKRSHLIN